MPSVFEKRAVVPQGSVFEKRAKPESLGKSIPRTAYQPLSGYLKKFTYPADLLQGMGVSEATDPEFLEHLRKIHEREGIPFDEEKYLEEVENAASYFPTQGNAERILEEQLGIPLQAKTGLQKGLNLAGTATAFTPGSLAQKGTAAIGAPVISEAAQELGVPEPFANIIGLGGAGYAGSKVPGELTIGKETKPSGLPARRYEKLEAPLEVSEKKLEKINAKIEQDFRNISEKIIEESPIGETADELANNVAFKQETRELLNQAEQIADKIPGVYSTKNLKKEIADVSASKKTGYLQSDYEKAYSKNIKEMIDEIPIENITPGDWVRQYRKNNAALTEYFEPGSSKAINRAKRDALLDHNRAIVKTMEKETPNSELAPIFKEGNERWSKIMDAEAIDDFIQDIFTDKKIDFKNIDKYFDKEGYSRIFKRSLGEKGAKDFEQLLKDMLSSESAYKMLKVAKQKGFNDLYSTASGYLINPKLGMALTASKAIKGSWKWALNSLLDKPQLIVTWKKGIANLKKGDFPKAEIEFNKLQDERETLRIEALKKFNERNRPIEAKPEIKPSEQIPHKPMKQRKTEKNISETKQISENLPKPKRKEIEIKLTNGSEKYNADVYDDVFAIFKTKFGDYSVTHIPTGRRFAAFPTKKNAIKMLHAMYEKNAFDKSTIFSSDLDSASYGLDREKLYEIINKLR